MIKGIIFDLDGTLLNTITDLNNSVNDTYKFFNYDKRNSEEETMSYVGHGIRNLIKKCFVDKDDTFIDEALEVFLNYYNYQYCNFTRPYEGVVETVNTLLNKGIKVGVNSNKNNNYTKHLIQINFPGINQDYVTGVKPGDKTKPDPTNVNSIIEKMNLNKEDILYVGDSPTDVQTAINANLKPIGVSWGFRDKANILKAGALIVVDKPQELLELL